MSTNYVSIINGTLIHPSDSI